MEVIRAAVKLGVGAQRAIAVTNGQKSYSYGQILRSAWELSTELHGLRFPIADEAHVKNDVLHDTTKAPRLNEQKPKGRKALEGARVGIMAVPCAEFVVGMWGTWLSGGVAVPLALSYPEAELLHVLTDANITTVITTDDHKELIQSVSEKCAAQLCILPSIPFLHDEKEDLAVSISDGSKTYQQILEEVSFLLAVEGGEESEAGLIIYTSGTTGKPKGAVHTHAGMAAQVGMLSNAWEYTQADCFLHCLPLHHVHGLFNALLAPLYAGATVEFLPKFSVSGIWQRWRESYPGKNEQSINPITCFTGVPTMYVRLFQGYERMDLESRKACALAAQHLRLMMCGSSALPLPVITQWEKVTGHRLLERYGMTEFGMALSNPLHGSRKPGSVGMPLPGIEFKILQDESADSHLATGELCIKSPSMFKEYWNQPQVTKDSFGSDGYFRTGDTVSLESDGYIQILGRTSVDILKYGGYKLSALEIESVLLEHPEISECAVLGLPDKDYGEVIAAVVIPNAELNREPEINLELLRDWALQRMAPYKVPQRLHVWKSLPRNTMGKVSKKELKQILLNGKAPGGQG